MSLLLVLTFKVPPIVTGDPSTIEYRAYSSTMASRSEFNFKRDVYYQIGYQDKYPTNTNTVHGELLDTTVFGSCEISHADREYGICFVVSTTASNNPVSSSHMCLASQEPQSTLSYGYAYRRAEHTFIQPYILNEHDWDSDVEPNPNADANAASSDSDTNSEDS